MSKRTEKAMRKKISIICMSVGILLMTAAISLALYNQYEESRAANAADSVLPLLHQVITANKSAENKPSDEMTVVDIGGYGYIGYLSIPALELELPVMSEWDYTRLKIAPCLYYGSVKTDNMVIAAHNYTCHFGRLSQLEIGDSVRFTDMDGRIYTYKVRDMEILPPTATEEMITSDWELSLYTCTYGGESRVTVRCERVEDSR